MSKYDEAVQAMRLGPKHATKEERVALLREAINEALEEAASIADGEAMLDDGGERSADAKGLREVAMRYKCRAVAARAIATDIRALTKEGL